MFVTHLKYISYHNFEEGVCAQIGICSQISLFENWTSVLYWVGRDSSVGVVTGYGLDGTGIKSRWCEIFCTCLDWPWGPPSLLYNGYQVFPDADPSPSSSAMVMKG